MNDVMVLMSRLASIIFIAAIGYVVSYRKIVNANQKGGISLILNRLALPMLIVTSIGKMQLSAETLYNSGIIIVGTCLIYAMCYLYSHFISKKWDMPNKERSVFVNASVHGNVAFLGFPLLLAVYGEEGLFYGSIFFMCDNVLMFTAGMRRLMRDYPKKKELAPVTIALIAGLAIMLVSNITGLNLTDNPLFTGMSDLGTVTTPLAFLFIGFTVHENNIMPLLKDKRALVLLLGKMVVIPLILMFILLPFKTMIPILLLKVIIVEALMPPYASLLSMAYEYQQDMKLAASLVVVGHIAVIVTIPILFTLMNFMYV
ncbi:AEC family transporter [Mycoplasma sp. P36-A1]|uniref:AEC family transporter n=1 Tax=Mycoplasma sp. P36-A1 TaxID=3252900 RepID=UPI003C2DE6D9